MRQEKHGKAVCEAVWAARRVKTPFCRTLRKLARSSLVRTTAIDPDHARG